MQLSREGSLGDLHAPASLRSSTAEPTRPAYELTSGAAGWRRRPPRPLPPMSREDTKRGSLDRRPTVNVPACKGLGQRVQHIGSVVSRLQGQCARSSTLGGGSRSGAKRGPGADPSFRGIYASKLGGSGGGQATPVVQRWRHAYRDVSCTCVQPPGPTLVILFCLGTQQRFHAGWRLGDRLVQLGILVIRET
jgi:hypothetical protein